MLCLAKPFRVVAVYNTIKYKGIRTLLIDLLMNPDKSFVSLARFICCQNFELRDC